MNDKPLFLDTNILIYAYSKQNPDKQEVAMRLVTCGETVISAQVINELCNVLRKKFPEAYANVESVLREIEENMPILPLTAALTRRAVALSKQHVLGFYDSLILSAAIEYECSAVISEDLQDSFRVDGVTVLNPWPAQVQ